METTTFTISMCSKNLRICTIRSMMKWSTIYNKWTLDIIQLTLWRKMVFKMKKTCFSPSTKGSNRKKTLLLQIKENRSFWMQLSRNKAPKQIFLTIVTKIVLLLLHRKMERSKTGDWWAMNSEFNFFKRVSFSGSRPKRIFIALESYWCTKSWWPGFSSSLFSSWYWIRIGRFRSLKSLCQPSKLHSLAT